MLQNRRVSELADAVLPMIRTRADLHRWSAANEHGRQMHEAVDLLEGSTAEPAEIYAVTRKAVASAITVIARADDSSGVIGDACRRLLDLHPKAAAAAKAPAGKLVDWMMAFQFTGEVDYFTLDPVAYAPALGEAGLASYRARLNEVAAGLPLLPPDTERWQAPYSHTRFVLDWNEQRLAVLDRDIEAIIRTHARDRRVAAWLEDTAKAFEEIGEIDLAIDWAKQAAHFDSGHQAKTAAQTWCRLLAEHRPAELVEARLTVFRRWPTSGHAAEVREAAGRDWDQHREEVMDGLADRPWESVAFALHSLKDAELAWNLAHVSGHEIPQLAG